MSMIRSNAPVPAPALASVATISRPFGTRIEATAPWGLTIAEMLRHSGIDAVLLRHADVYLVDPTTDASTLIYRDLWHKVRPRPGCELVIRVWPGKGGGGKSILSIVLGVAIMAAAAFAGPLIAGPAVLGLTGTMGTVVGGLVSGAIGIVGNLLVSALIPPPKPPKLSGNLGGSSRADSPAYSISGAQNQLDPFGVVPRIYGRFRYSPKYAAKPYTEIVGSDQYLRLLFDFGYGPLDLEDHRIGETTLEQYSGVETHVHPNWDPNDPADALTIYTNDINETPLSIEIANDGVRTAAIAATGTLTFSGNASASQTVTIGSNVYTFVSSLSATANQVLVGVDAAASIRNLQNAINRGSGAGTQYSTGTVVHPSVKALATSSTVLTVTARTTGAAGNAITTTETLGSAVWASGTLTGGADIVPIDALTEEEKWVSNTTDEGIDQFSGDISFLNGLFRISNSGNKMTVAVRFDIRYRAAGSSDPWRYLSRESSNTLNFSGQPGNGQTVTIGGKAYTFQTVLTNVNGNVAIGATLADSIANLAAAIMLGAGSGTAYAAATTRHAQVNATEAATALTITARHLGNLTGPDGDGIACSETLGSGAWAFPATQNGADAKRVLGHDSNVRVGFGPVRVPVKDQYEVQIRRLDKNSTDTTVTDRSYWTALRSIKLQSPVRVAGRCLVEMRILATDQLNGVVSTYNAIATSKLRTWDGAAWTEAQATRSPAWISADILMGSANGRRLLDDRVFLAALKDWAEACAVDDGTGEPLFCCDGVFDFRTTVYQALADVCSTGRATPAMKRGLFSVVRDIPQSVPVQHITPRNSWGFKGTIIFPDPPHALRIQFKNEEIGWQNDERTVYADGYDETTATNFEVLSLPMVTRPAQIWRDGRYYQAAVKLRPATYQTNMDPEWMQCDRGDLVLLAHDAMRVGIVTARIKQLVLDGDGDLVAVTLDEEVTLEAGKSYALFVRRAADNETLTLSVLNTGQITRTLDLVAPVPEEGQPDEGDLATFGEATRVMIEALVKAIEPSSDQNARLTLVDAAPAVHTADQGAVPAYTPSTTALVPVQHRRPPTPVITGIRSDEVVLAVNPDGSYLAAIMVTFGGLSGGDAVAAQVEAWFRPSGSDAAYQRGPVVPATLGALSILPVDTGETYDLKFYSVTTSGVRCEVPAVVLGHTVIGDTSLPPAPQNPDVSGDLFRWAYPTPPNDFRGGGFRVKAISGVVAKWSSGTPLSDNLITATSADISSLSGGDFTLMVKAVDRAGNESAEAAYYVVHRGAPQIANAVTEVDLAAADFPGTIVNGTVTSSVLTADTEDTAMYPSDPSAAMYSSTPTDPMWTATAKALTYIATLTPDPADLGSEIRLLVTATDAPYTISYSVDDGVNWIGWPGHITAADIDYQIKVEMQGGGAPGSITVMTIIYDVADEEENTGTVAIAAAGTRLPLTKSFRFIDLVRADLVYESGETPVGIIVVDYGVVVGNVVTDGPLIKTVNGSQTGVDGHVRAFIHGARNNAS